MKRIATAALAIGVLLCNHAVYAQTQPMPDQLFHFAFGSCAKERLPQPIWYTILKQEPQLFLFIGDNHYADYWDAWGNGLTSGPVTDPARFRQAYTELGEKSGYIALRNKMPVLATWDDHDYGSNDGGKHFPLKQQSQKAFLDFFDFDPLDPIHKQEGIYHSRMAHWQNRAIQFIMLDTRYHRDNLVPNPMGQPTGKGPYVPTEDKQTSMLGDAQWLWLEQELRKPADIRFIISSVQVVAFEHAYEGWGNFPHERQRLYDLISATQANGVVFLSGDRHLTEVSVDSGELGHEVPYPMWDFTASGMTDPFDQVSSDNTYRRGRAYRGAHFGTVTIHWADKLDRTRIEMKAIKQNGDTIYSHSVDLDQLNHSSSAAIKTE